MVPSGDHEPGINRADFSSNISASPLPSAAFPYGLNEPDRSEANVTLVPSGVQTG
jgi:hypothetical protein